MVACSQKQYEQWWNNLKRQRDAIRKQEARDNAQAKRESAVKEKVSEEYSVWFERWQSRCRRAGEVKPSRHLMRILIRAGANSLPEASERVSWDEFLKLPGVGGAAIWELSVLLDLAGLTMRETRV